MTLVLMLALATLFPVLGFIERVLANRGVARDVFLLASPWGGWMLSFDLSYLLGLRRSRGVNHAS